MSQKNHEPTQIKLLSDLEMDELRGNGIFKTIWKDIKESTGFFAGVAGGMSGGYSFSESVIDYGRYKKQQSGGVWQCFQNPCQCGACDQGQGGRPVWN
ncbi:MAG: hypothetical protein QF752_12035 [Planctomycetota bacterium]|jgi:hypothetical protein|nr:hypothetical protein [Planctomycetota bacterium]